ncbi:hypothetical protein F7725_019415 [Dissostichus mawsoni]|uniref:Synapse differentiation-inducing gene protein 1-like n=1 Tax=Dissostichus mawsoni TaxID=36200 RepID=A0A7J5YJM5_DISMA|nr:hypothetical protein F7725_019415 [Dissostichus mawsoni]
MTPVAMENLSELQNPLLDKNSKHMVNGYGGEFPNNQYQENIINYYAGGGGEGGGGGNVNNGNVVSGGSYNTNGKMKSQQLLDATSLHLAVEAFYRPNFILYKEDSGSIKAKEYKSECCETTFTEKKAKEASNTTGADTPATEDPQAKLLEDGENIKIQTVSYEVEEEEYVEYETDCSSDSESEDNFIVVPLETTWAWPSSPCCATTKAVNKGDFPLANIASRRALFLAALSITIGTGVYVGVVVALIAYLSKPGHI